MTAAADAGAQGGKRWVERVLLLAAWAAVAWFHVWTVRSTGEPFWPKGEQRDYFNLLIDGWLDGQLHMKVEVPEELLRLPDPYDPAQRRPGLGLHDASLYQGKYYVYFGVAPAAVAMLPFRVVTGTDLPLALAVLLFVHAGFVAASALWLAVRRRYFAGSSPAVAAAGVLVLGLAALGPLLLRRPAMWELPIAGGYFFAMAMLGCVWRSVEAEGVERRARWFAAAGLALGLAVASRPTYLFATPALVVPVLAWAWRGRRVPWREGLHGLVPLALVGLAMAGHNHARFGSPLQFGQAYQLSLDYESKLPHFQARYVPYNVAQHFFGGARWERYFPFARPPELKPAPAGYTQHRGDVQGVAANMPVFWGVLALPLALWRRKRAARWALGVWLATTLVLVTGTAGVMLSFFSALARYQLEFVPTLALLAVTGVVALERAVAIAARGGWRLGLVRVGIVGAGGWSAVFAALYSLQVDGLLKEKNPRLHEAVAQTLNTIPATVERWVGVEFGAVELRVRLDGLGAGETNLLTVGDGERKDVVWGRREPDGGVRLGYRGRGEKERVSDVVRGPEGAAEVAVRVTLGSLYPPRAHPFFAGMSAERVQALRRTARIEVEGRTVVEGWHRFESGGKVMIGRAAGFPGEVREVRRMGAVEVTRAPVSASDTVRLRVTWPEGKEGQRDPLVVSGRAGAADFLLVEYLSGARVRFALDHWGAGPVASEPVAIAPGKAQVLEVTMASLATVADAEGREAWRKGRLRVALDGREVLAAETEFYVVEPGEVWIGRNPVGGTSCGEVFGGKLEILDGGR